MEFEVQQKQGIEKDSMPALDWQSVVELARLTESVEPSAVVVVERDSSTGREWLSKSGARLLIFFVAFSVVATNNDCGLNPRSVYYLTGS